MPGATLSDPHPIAYVSFSRRVSHMTITKCTLPSNPSSAAKVGSWLFVDSGRFCDSGLFGNSALFRDPSSSFFF